MEPDISVIVTCFGQVKDTWTCVQSIRAGQSDCSVEIIVIDDASNDPDLGQLVGIPGVRFLQNGQNLGYVKNCNKGAAHARGRFLLLLNNDVEVMPGSLDAMLELMSVWPDAGLVGGKLIFPDGHLQEAGSIVLNDGTAWNFGRGDSPDRPEYNYVREVDYCSGAALLVPRALFNELNGFDEIFSPAYYEDTDLAFRVRQRGLRVLYTPRAVFRHKEGVSHGTNPRAGVKAYQALHQQVFHDRWRETLMRDHAAPGKPGLRARDRAKHRAIGLLIAAKPPEQSDLTSCVAERFLASGWILKLAIVGHFHDEGRVEEWTARGIEVHRTRTVHDLNRLLAHFGPEVDRTIVLPNSLSAWSRLRLRLRKSSQDYPI